MIVIQKNVKKKRISYLHDINIIVYIMGLSKIYMLFIIFFCYIIVYISFKIIIDYFDSSKLIYLNMYSIYYICFLITLILALIFNYYINADEDVKIPGFIEEPITSVEPTTSAEPITTTESMPEAEPIKM